MRLPAPMAEETLGKIMLVLFALAAFGVVTLFLLTKSEPSSAVQLNYAHQPIVIDQ
ncbi:MAG TPA: hypothetical protein VKZ79_06675 [Alphaproteobacteria bacterium]|nr:hypothetical protein [Alphaproteobacteria bacterium]